MIIGTSMGQETCLSFTQFISLEEKLPDGYIWSGERLTRKQLTSRPVHLWTELWKSMAKHAKLKEKQKWSHEQLHLENARKLRGIYFIDPEDEEFKETIKNARKKLETPIAPAMPCKIMKNCGSGGSNKIKTRLACILETGDHHMKGGSECPLTDQSSHFGAMVEYHPISAKDKSRLHQFGPKVLPGISSVMYCMRWGIWKRDIMVAHVEELEEMDASELHARRLNAKEVLPPMKDDKFIIPVAVGAVKLSGEDQDLRTSTLIRDSPDRGEEQDDLRRESDGSSFNLTTRLIMV